VSARLLAGALAIACLVAGGSPIVQAQFPTSRTPDFLTRRVLPTSRTPDLLMSEGHALFDAGRYKEAAASYERAMQLGVARPHEAARGVSRSYEKLGNWKQASRWATIADLLEHPERAEQPLRISLLLKI